jgi:Domain of unknown function (DUF4864)
MWKILIAGLIAASLHAAPAPAQSESDAIRQVISDQISAFRVDDFAAAFTFASPAIRRLFGNPARFGEMVRSGYPMVWRPADVRFAALQQRAGRVVQGVLVTDQAGTVHLLDYEMIDTSDGWQIDGVRVRRPGDAGA